MRSFIAALLLLCAVPAYGFNFDWGGSAKALWVDLVQSLSWTSTDPGWSTNAYEFGSQDVDTTTTATLTITNSGNDTAEEVATTVTGAGFSLYSTTTFGNISAARTRVAKVKFTPSGAGEFTGFASYSAPNIARVDVALSGTGVDAIGSVVLAGNSAITYDHTFYQSSGGQALYAPFTAASAGTLLQGYWNGNNQTGASFVKMCVTTTSGTIFTECSSPVAIGSSLTDLAFTFSGSNSIAAGQTLTLGVIPNAGYINAASDAATWVTLSVSNTYASPTAFSGGSSDGPLGNMKIWVTN